ncbi:hypothetical protein ACGF1Z_12465 [Streptomyces sp. NPDC048018]|uniref:hypothetical protein n=1 Tax=Streptomyces sp. NPDC048018 TaxID=3365499 RepID=UPI0037166366
MTVHALAHRPLTVEAVAEFLGLPAAPPVPEDDEDAVGEEVRRRGWEGEDRLVCDSYRTAHGHVMCSETLSPFGDPDARAFLVFGELYPVDPHDESLANASWLNGLLDAWQKLPGWSGRRPATARDCEDLLAQAAQMVGDHLGASPERTVLSSEALAAGPRLTQRVWRTAGHAVVLGPAPDNGPYGYLTHLQLSCTPLACGPELPPAGDEDGMAAWIGAHVDW